MSQKRRSNCGESRCPTRRVLRTPILVVAVALGAALSVSCGSTDSSVQYDRQILQTCLHAKVAPDQGASQSPFNPPGGTLMVGVPQGKPATFGREVVGVFKDSPAAHKAADDVTAVASAYGADVGSQIHVVGNVVWFPASQAPPKDQPLIERCLA